MKSLFADSFYYIALLNRNDAAHERAIELAHVLHTHVVTTAFVLIEVGDAMGKASQRGSFLALTENLAADPNVTVLSPSQELYEQGLSIYSRRPDKNWSLTDCISFAAMERLQLREALTGDRHFTQAGFSALLA